MGSEAPGGHLQAATAQRLDDGIDQRFGHGPRRGGVPGRPAPLAHVGVERELGDDEHRRPEIAHRDLAAGGAAAIAGAVEQAQLGDLAGDRGDLGGTVVVGGAHERKQPGTGDLPDGHRPVLAIHMDSSAVDPLKNSAHQRRQPPRP